MSIRSILGRTGLAASAAAMVLTGALAAPGLASAQPGYYAGPPQDDYYDTCQSDKTGREVAGGVIGAIGGAVLGSNLAHGSGRTGGALLGGALGAAAGAGIGGATAGCDSAPPPPPSYAAYPPPPPPPADNGYERYDPRDDRGGDCTLVESRVYFPDGTIQRDRVQACRGQDGRWFVDE